MSRYWSLLGAVGVAVACAGCAVTDYDGLPGHKTMAEAKLWGQEISFITGDPALDGTYAVTVKYDNHGGRDTKMKITTYRNPVVDSFSRDGVVDRDGDDVQGRSGVLGGKFLPQWVVVDPAADCQFFANRIQSHGADPMIALCGTTNEEIDKDFELQASFTSFGDLINQIWSGAVADGFTTGLDRVTLGGVEVPLAQAVPITARSNGLRPMQLTVDLTGPGGAALVQALLDHTAPGQLTTLGLGFEGGMSIDLPAQWRVAFNHEALKRLR
jgi:hypothetical protein